MARFIHPVHARGVRSTSFTTFDNGPLTDRKIRRYALEGRYGEAMREREASTKSGRRSESARKSRIQKLLEEVAELLA